MKNYKFDKYWILGLLGFVGFYKLPAITGYFQGQESIWELSNILWFTWFFYFITKKNSYNKNNKL